MIHRYSIQDVKLKSGYFYELFTERVEDVEFMRKIDVSSMVQSVNPGDEEGNERMYLNCVDAHSLYWNRCGHRVGSRFQFCPTFDYSDLNACEPISWMQGANGIVCKKDLAMRLLESELKGIVLQRPEFVSPIYQFPKPKDWFFVSGGGQPAIKMESVTPAPYKCWNCGFPPICEVCYDRPTVCPKCGEKYWVMERDWDGKDESKLVVKFGDHLIVDLKNWDGSDYFGTMITHRMLQFLLRCHAHPFRALPVPVDVKGASKKDLERLEKAKLPLS